MNKLSITKKGAECCSDQLIATHYMSPQDIIRLDLAFQVQRNIINLYNRHSKLRKNTTFDDLYKTYIRLQDFEEDTFKYQEFFLY